jgi:hypothetical protein
VEEFWVKITLSCSVTTFKADPLDLNDVSSQIMSPRTYVIGEPMMKIVIRPFITD